MALDAIFREHWGRVLATLIGMFGDIELAEDVAQEAFLVAAERWDRDGVPANPGGWLITVARNRGIDRLRRQRLLNDRAARLGRQQSIESEAVGYESETFRDERLELVFTCCHPALAVEVQVALTLRTLGGLSTEEIGLAFLVPVETMSKRLTRAKHKIRDARIPFAVPAADQLVDRLDAVLGVVYLIFNQGWGGGRVDLAAEAIGLGRALDELMPDEGQVSALLALMLLHEARSAARRPDSDTLVRFDRQDRERWDRDQIDEGRRLLERVVARGVTGPYVVQAAIAEQHLHEPRDWRRIATLYATLSAQTGSPVVELNRAVAVAEVDGPLAGLRIIDDLDLDHYRYYHSARGELLARSGDVPAARSAFGRAIELARTDAERRSLVERLAELPPA